MLYYSSSGRSQQVSITLLLTSSLDTKAIGFSYPFFSIINQQLLQSYSFFFLSVLQNSLYPRIFLPFFVSLGSYLYIRVSISIILTLFSLSFYLEEEGPLYPLPFPFFLEEGPTSGILVSLSPSFYLAFFHPLPFSLSLKDIGSTRPFPLSFRLHGKQSNYSRGYEFIWMVFSNYFSSFSYNSFAHLSLGSFSRDFAATSTYILMEHKTLTLIQNSPSLRLSFLFYFFIRLFRLLISDLVKESRGSARSFRT